MRHAFFWSVKAGPKARRESLSVLSRLSSHSGGDAPPAIPGDLSAQQSFVNEQSRALFDLRDAFLLTERSSSISRLFTQFNTCVSPAFSAPLQSRRLHP